MEIRANELRIGNYLQGTEISIPSFGIYSDGVLQISAYGIFQISEGNLCHYEPIPLTEEWLIKFGFETDEITFWKSKLDVGNFKGGIFYYLPHGLSGVRGIEIKSVHQLQNLYFALTGKEL